MNGLKSRWRRRGERQERGFVLVTATLMILVLLGFLGLALDVGYIEFTKRRIQTAADAAAIGGATQLRVDNSTDNVTSSGKHDSDLNGFKDGTNGVTVTLNTPPSSGSYTGDSGAVEAIVKRSQSTYFAGLFNLSTVTIAARAVARSGSGSNCVYVLDPTASGAFTVSGTASFKVQCGIQIDSTSSSALSVSGTSCVSGTQIDIVGDYSDTSNSFGTAACGNPTPSTGVESVADPLAWLPTPSVGGCDHTNLLISSGPAPTLYPGVYCGGITLTGQNGAYLTSGTYILLGGGLTVTGGAWIQGATSTTGVTFYNTSDLTHVWKNIQLSGGSNIVLRAPTSGTYEGVLFFDRTVSITSQIVTGGSTALIEGALYFPNSPLTFTGNSSAGPKYMLIVANKLTSTGTSDITNDYSTLSDGSPFRTITVQAE
jgi:hypothetical protein